MIKLTVPRTTIIIAGLLVAANASAVDMPDAAKKNGCTGCHSIDKKLMGPAWQDVANKYKGNAAAEKDLIAKISKGGSGNWGDVPMPPMDPSGTKQAEIGDLVKFILGLAK